MEHLLEEVGSELESLHLAIRQSEQLWGDGTSHLCHILARTCSNVKYLHIGEEDSLNQCIRSTSCCCDLFDLAVWGNLVDCHLCVYPGRGGCLDQSEGSLNALVESARCVALRNSKGLGTIIRIKGSHRNSFGDADSSGLFIERRSHMGYHDGHNDDLKFDLRNQEGMVR